MWLLKGHLVDVFWGSNKLDPTVVIAIILTKIVQYSLIEHSITYRRLL